MQVLSLNTSGGASNLWVAWWFVERHSKQSNQVVGLMEYNTIVVGEIYQQILAILRSDFVLDCEHMPTEGSRSQVKT